MNAAWKLSVARWIWCRLFLQLIILAASRAAWTAGKSSPTKSPMIAMTTSSSTRVKPALRANTRRLDGSLNVDFIFSFPNIRWLQTCDFPNVELKRHSIVSVSGEFQANSDWKNLLIGGQKNGQTPIFPGVSRQNTAARQQINEPGATFENVLNIFQGMP